MTEAEAIAGEMSIVRARGLRRARAMGHDFERLSDWREHVRAHPIPLAVAAMVAGYYVIPSKSKPSDNGWQKPATTSPFGMGAKQDAAERPSAKSTAGAAVLGIVGSMVSNLIRSYMSKQIHSLFSGNDHDQASLQRETSHRTSI
jgi:hypothetical protein